MAAGADEDGGGAGGGWLVWGAGINRDVRRDGRPDARVTERHEQEIRKRDDGEVSLYHNV